MKELKVIKNRDFLYLVDDNGEVLGMQTDLSIKNSIDDRGLIEVSVSFKIPLDNINLKED